MKFTQKENKDSTLLLEITLEPKDYEGKVQEMHIDILGTENRGELINTGKIHYSKHTSWKYIENKNPHDHTELKDIIDSCLSNDVSNAVLNRTERKFF